MSALSQFATFFQGGGPFMYVILVLGVCLVPVPEEAGRD